MTAITPSIMRRLSRLGNSSRSLFLAVDRHSRRVRRHPLLWLTAAAVLLALQISPWWYSSADGSLYLSMARRYVLTEATSATGVGQDVPPGYALLISPAFLLDERPFLALSLFQWLVGVAMVAGVYHWGRQVAPRAAIWIALLTAANAGVCYYYRRTLKEMVFMAAAIWAVNALNALAAAQSRGQLLRRVAIGGGVVAGCLLIRYSAVVLVPGFALSVLLSRRQTLTPRQWRLVLGVLAGVAALIMAFVITHQGRSYLGAFSTFFADVTANLTEGLRMRIASIVRICVPGMFKAYARQYEWLNWNIALGVLLLIIVIAGWYRAARRQPDPLVLTFPMYVGLYMAWPFDQGARFMIPMAPVLIVCFWFAMERVARVRTALFAGCLAAHLAATVGYWILIDAPRAAAWHAHWTSIEQLAGRIDPERGRVVCPQVPNDVRHMLAVCLNDPGLILPNELGLDPERAEWALQARGRPVPRGWEPVVSAGEYGLLQRDRLATRRD